MLQEFIFDCLLSKFLDGLFILIKADLHELEIDAQVLKKAEALF